MANSIAGASGLLCLRSTIQQLFLGLGLPLQEVRPLWRGS